MRFKELATLTRQELLEKERTLKEQLHKLSYQRFAGRVEKPHQFSLLKKDIARIKTTLKQNSELKAKS